MPVLVIPINPGEIAINRAGGRRRTEQYRNGINDFARDLRAQFNRSEGWLDGGRTLFYSGRVRVRILFVFSSASWEVAPDLDAAIKATFDAIQKSKIIVDDRQIRKLEVEDDFDPHNPRIHVEIEKWL